MLDDADETVVEVAAWAIGEQGKTTQAIIDRLSALAGTHADALCREAAVAALGALGHERGLPAIMAALDDNNPAPPGGPASPSSRPPAPRSWLPCSVAPANADWGVPPPPKTSTTRSPAARRWADRQLAPPEAVVTAASGEAGWCHLYGQTAAARAAEPRRLELGATSAAVGLSLGSATSGAMHVALEGLRESPDRHAQVVEHLQVLLGRRPRVVR